MSAYLNFKTTGKNKINSLTLSCSNCYNFTSICDKKKLLKTKNVKNIGSQINKAVSTLCFIKSC